MRNPSWTGCTSLLRWARRMSALGKAHEGRQNYERSFRHYRQGNDLKRAQMRYSADAMRRELEQQQEACSARLFARHAGAGHPASDPIFILGLPLAGSTLLEQILASHSQIDGTLELPNIMALAHRLRGRKASSGRVRQPINRKGQDAWNPSEPWLGDLKEPSSKNWVRALG